MSEVGVEITTENMKYTSARGHFWFSHSLVFEVVAPLRNISRKCAL